MNLDDRMKAFERSHSPYLPPRMPVLIRVDGKAFHTYTRGMKKPFDTEFTKLMDSTATALVNSVQNAAFAFVQSDEISIFCNTYTKFTTQPWLGNRVQRITSVAASIATAWFNEMIRAGWTSGPAMFDARTWVLPKEEVCNYFIWRQQDATRNSIQAAAQAQFSQKELHKKNRTEMQDMLICERGINWDSYPVGLKRGRAIYRVEEADLVYDPTPPIFTKDREYIERHVNYSEEEEEEEE